MTRSFRLAQMSPLILTLTVVMLALPVALALGAILFNRLINFPVLFFVVIYGWIWTRFRPTRFVVHQRALEVIWPLKRREISRENITSVRLINRQELTREIGWGMRVGAGGLWGGFGWLWTGQRGIVQMYISRTDQFIWIERAGDRPWLITPEQPEDFVRALSRQ